MSTFLSLLAAVFLTVEVANTSDEYREQVVELPLDSVLQQLGTSADSLRVTEAAGLDVPFQLTHDGKLLIEAAVRKGGVARFTISKGEPQTFPFIPNGRMTLHGRTTVAPIGSTDRHLSARASARSASMCGRRTHRSWWSISGSMSRISS